MDLNLDNPEQIKLLINMLQQMLPQEQHNDINQVEESESTIKTKSVRSDKIKSRPNKFLDMPEKNMHKSDSAIDKKLCTSPPTPRNRKFIPISVVCRVCGKSEKVNPAIVPEPKDRYKCNRCSATSGG
jgi:hypothetical protein